MKYLCIILVVITLGACSNRDYVASSKEELIRVPVTKDATLFVKSFLNDLQTPTFTANREFCGYFGRDEYGYVVATIPIKGHLDSCELLFPESNLNVFASYHSHGAFDNNVDTEVPSPSDILSDRIESVAGYVSTPGGRIWLNNSANLTTTQICGRGCIKVDPTFVPNLYGPVAKKYTLQEIKKRVRGWNY